MKAGELIGAQIATFHYHNGSPFFVAKFELSNHRLGGLFKDSVGKNVELKELQSPEIFRAKLIAEGFIEANEATESYKTLLRYLAFPEGKKPSLLW
jgi:hypothetical protein